MTVLNTIGAYYLDEKLFLVYLIYAHINITSLSRVSYLADKTNGSFHRRFTDSIRRLYNAVGKKKGPSKIIPSLSPSHEIDGYKYLFIRFFFNNELKLISDARLDVELFFVQETSSRPRLSLTLKPTE